VELARLAIVGGASLAAGFVNAVAGGGSLLSFPALVGAGLPALGANVTNTVALCPGYLGGAITQRRDLAGQRRRIGLLVPTSAVGGALGALLLLWTGEGAFQRVVPFLLVFAVGLLAFQKRLHAFVRAHGRAHRDAWVVAPVGIAAVYGGYFGAALSVILLAALAAAIDDSLNRLNALKQTVSLSTNVSAAVVFLFSRRVEWSAALVVATGAIVGGAFGGLVASHVPARLLRGIVIACGLGMAAYYFARL
jgi:uncharacterized membrane protein YfcA